MGFQNDIACCELTDKAKDRLFKKFSYNCAAIVVKFAPKEIFFKLDRLELIANHVILSEHKITPRLLYIDDHCMIHEYIEVGTYAGLAKGLETNYDLVFFLNFDRVEITNKRTI